MNKVSSPRSGRSLQRPFSPSTCLLMEPHLSHSYSAILGLVILSRQLERIRDTASLRSLQFCRPHSEGLWWRQSWEKRHRQVSLSGRKLHWREVGVGLSPLPGEGVSGSDVEKHLLRRVLGHLATETLKGLGHWWELH